MVNRALMITIFFSFFFKYIFTSFNYTLLLNMPRVVQIGPSHK